MILYFRLKKLNRPGRLFHRRGFHMSDRDTRPPSGLSAPLVRRNTLNALLHRRACETQPHQGVDSLLRGGSSKRSKKSLPLRCNFNIRRQTVDSAVYTVPIVPFSCQASVDNATSPQFVTSSRRNAPRPFRPFHSNKRRLLFLFPNPRRCPCLHPSPLVP